MNVSVATDSAQNLYVVFITDTTIRFQKLDATRSLAWSLFIPNTDGWQHPYAVVDSTGAVYVSYERVMPNGDRDVWVAKVASDGSAVLWIQNFGTLATDEAAKLAVDSEDNIILVYSAGDTDIAVRKIAPDGSILWSLDAPVVNPAGTDIAPSIAIGPGGLLVTYVTEPENVQQTTAFSSVGTVQWQRNYPETTPVLPCFLAGTPVETRRRGIVSIETLCIGDEIRSGERSSAWVTVRRLQMALTAASEKTLPFIIPRGWSCGAGTATADIFISPNHCVAVPGHGMVRAADLGFQRATHIRRGSMFAYYNIEVDNWENIEVAGLEVESLAPVLQLRMTVHQLRAKLISQFGRIDEATLATLLTTLHPLPDKSVRVQIMGSAATEHRTARIRTLTKS
jgi:hypothetical protein